MNSHMRIVIGLPKVLASLVDMWPGKLLGALVAGVVEYLFPAAGLVAMAKGAFALIMVDTITGWWAAMVTKEGISSAKFSRVLTKLLGYLAMVIVASVAAQTLPGASEFHYVSVAFVVGCVVITESISILENVKKMGLKPPALLMGFFRERLKESQKPPKGD